MDDVQNGVGVVLQALLDEAGQRGEHQRVVEAECVEHLETSRGLRNAGMAFIGLPITSRKLLPPLPWRKYSSCAPGFATTSNVGLGM